VLRRGGGCWGVDEFIDPPMGSCHTNSLWSYRCSENNDSFGKVHRVLRR